MDWTNLFNDPKYNERLEAHSRMPGWRTFADSRLHFLESIQGYKDRKYKQKLDYTLPPPTKKEKIVPVMRWRVDNEGNRVWVFDLTEDGVLDQLVKFQERGRKGRQRIGVGRLNTLAGLMYEASYFPEETTAWPEQMDYRGGTSGDIREIGPTQVLPAAIMKVRALLESPLLSAFEKYCVDPESYVPPVQQVSPFPVVRVSGKTNENPEEIIKNNLSNEEKIIWNPNNNFENIFLKH